MRTPYALFYTCFLIVISCFAPGFAALTTSQRPVEFVAVIASYNNERWCIKNLESVAMQTYPYLHIIYVNDCSTDKTGELVATFIKEHNLEDRCTLINNPVRKGAMQNFYETISKIEPYKVVAHIDGDDWLKHNKVFELLASIYQDGEIWVTTGNYETEPFTEPSICFGYPQKVLKACSFRRYKKWQGCQLRTFYAGLFHRIQKVHFMWNSQFLPM